MPQYRYYCPECSHEWENAHTIKDRLLEQCPQCCIQAKINFSGLNQQISCADLYGDGILIDDHSSDPNDAVIVRSKKEHKEFLARTGGESPAF